MNGATGVALQFLEFKVYVGMDLYFLSVARAGVALVGLAEIPFLLPTAGYARCRDASHTSMKSDAAS